MSILDKLELPAPAGMLLKQQLELMKTVQLRIKEDELALESMMSTSPAMGYLQSLPGMGKSSRQ
jgi:hypothetical protein